MPADSTAAPVQETVRFAALYANVYADVSTGEVELGARVYRSPAAADERRQQHPAREGLVFVCVAPVSACIPDALVRTAIGNAGAAAAIDPFDHLPDTPPESGS